MESRLTNRYTPAVTTKGWTEVFGRRLLRFWALVQALLFRSNTRARLTPMAMLAVVACGAGDQPSDTSTPGPREQVGQVRSVLATSVTEDFSSGTPEGPWPAQWRTAVTGNTSSTTSAAAFSTTGNLGSISGAPASGSVLFLPAPSLATDSDQSVNLALTAGNGHLFGGLVSRINSPSPISSYYGTIVGLTSANPIRFYKSTNGAYSQIGPVASSTPLFGVSSLAGSDSWYRIRLKVTQLNATQTRLQVKLWQGAEPSGWTLEHIDSEPRLQGVSGYQGIVGSVNSGNTRKLVYDDYVLTSPLAPGACGSNSDCSNGRYCSQDGECRLPGATCSSNQMCGAGQVCTAGECACPASAPNCVAPGGPSPTLAELMAGFPAIQYRRVTYARETSDYFSWPTPTPLPATTALVSPELRRSNRFIFTVPAQQNVTLRVDVGNTSAPSNPPVDVVVYDATGAVIWKSTFESLHNFRRERPINLGSLAAGNYEFDVVAQDPALTYHATIDAGLPLALKGGADPAQAGSNLYFVVPAEAETAFLVGEFEAGTPLQFFAPDGTAVTPTPLTPRVYSLDTRGKPGVWRTSFRTTSSRAHFVNLPDLFSFDPNAVVMSKRIRTAMDAGAGSSVAVTSPNLKYNNRFAFRVASASAPSFVIGNNTTVATPPPLTVNLIDSTGAQLPGSPFSITPNGTPQPISAGTLQPGDYELHLTNTSLSNAYSVTVPPGTPFVSVDGYGLGNIALATNRAFFTVPPNTPSVRFAAKPGTAPIDLYNASGTAIGQPVALGNNVYEIPNTIPGVWAINLNGAAWSDIRLLNVPQIISFDKNLLQTISPGTVSCTTNANCASNETCQNGVCACSSPTACGATCHCAVGGQCNDYTACLSGLSCVGGTCQDCTVTGCNGAACDANSDCAPSLLCVSGQCRPLCAVDPSVPGCVGGTGDIGDACTEHSCRTGLECGVDNGLAFDQPAGRYCWTGGCDLSSAGSWCGTLDSPCGKCIGGSLEPTCQPTCAGKVCGDNSADGCSGTCVLCTEREGECKKDAECSPGLVCGQGAGPRFGLLGVVNACWRPVCESLDPSEVPCGTVNSTCGLCPACQPDCQGKDYGSDGCGGSCGQCSDGEWEGPNFECRAPLGVKSTLPPAIDPADYITQHAGKIDGAFDITHGGQARYTVPLVLPPGRAGMQPQLALTYNSAQRNGELGQGWSLSGLHAITKCRETISQDGAARGVIDTANTASDVWGETYESAALCLDGARLFVVPGQGPELQYRTEIDTGVKVVAVDANDLNAGFRAYYPDGRIATLVHPDALPDPEPLDDVWVVTRIEDRAGNYLTVEHDARAYGSLREFAILRPKKIWYAGHTDGTAPDTLVEFHYERRPDVTNGYRDGVLLLNDSILKTISISLGEMPVREYRLDHTVIRPGGPSALTHLHECTPAFEGGSEFICKPSTVFDYENDVPRLSNGVPIGLHPNNPQHPQFNTIPDMPLDMNGDGVDDLLMVVLDDLPLDQDPNRWNKHVEVLISGRELINVGATTNVLIPADVYNAPEIFNVIDYDLDGRDDLLMEHPIAESNYTVLTYKDSGFQVVDLGIKSSMKRPMVGPGETYLGNVSNRTYVLDADGDGVRDILRCTGEIPQTGDTYSKGPFTWTLVHLPDLKERPIQLNQGCMGHYIAADLSGSGRQSLLMQTHAYLGGSSEITRKESYLAISFEGAEYGKEGPVGAVVHQTHIPVRRGQPALPLDANGDGITDLLNYLGSGYLETCLGTGRNDSFAFDCHPAHNHFNGEAPGSSPPLLRTTSGARYQLGPVMDVNGDGRDDVMIAGRDESTWSVLESSVVGTDDRYYLAFSGWRVRQLPGAPPTTWSAGSQTGRPLAMDINGDGVRDFVQKPTGGYSPANLAAYVRIAPYVPKLVRVVDGLGGSIEIDYGSSSTPLNPPPPGSPLASHFAEGAYAGTGAGSCDYADGLHCRTPRHAVVRKHRQFQGPSYLTSFVREFVHTYSGARIGLDGRGYLGFGFHSVSEAPRGHSISWLDNTTRDPTSGAFPYLGREYSHTEIISLDGAGTLFTRSDVELDLRRNPNNERIVTPFNRVTVESKSENWDGSNITIGSFEKIVDIDQYGNQTSVTSTWSGGGRDEQETIATTYAHENRAEFVNDWLVHLPETRTLTSSGIPGESLQDPTSRRTDFEYYSTGLLRGAIVERQRAAYTLSTRLVRDDYGNVLTIESCAGTTDCAEATNTQTSTIEYEGRQVFPELITDAEGYKREVEYNHVLGLETRTIENGKTGLKPLTSYAVHDGFGRTRVENRPDGSATRTSYQAVIGDSMRIISKIDGGPTLKRRLDELGRERSRGLTSLGGTEYTTYTTYTAFGQVATTSRDQDTFDIDNRTQYDHDPLGRLLITVEPGGVQTANCYRGLVSCVIDAENNARCVEKDQRGRLLFAGDPIAVEGDSCMDVAEAFATPSDRPGVAYTYGPFSTHEQAIRMPEGTVISQLSYDRLGRPASRSDIGAGTTTFTHTPFGELETASDSNAAVTFRYDNLGRRRFRIVNPVAGGEPDTTAEWRWRDDFQDRLDFDRANDVETIRDYDDLGRLTHLTQSVGGEDFVTTVDEFDVHGRPRFVSYPGGAELRIEHVYDEASGVLKEVKAAPLDETAPRPSYWKLDALDEFGQIRSESFGNGLATARTYQDFTGLPKTIITAAPDEDPVQNVAYTFYDDRNLKSIADPNGASYSYKYDAFGRVDEVLEGSAVVADYGYTVFGSIETNAKNWSYGYDPASPHSVDTIADGDNVSSFQYNTNGTLRHRSAGALPELTVEYTDFAKPRKIWEGQEEFATIYQYSADEAKVVKRSPDSTTVYFGRAYYREEDTETGDFTHHYLISNQSSVVAEVIRGESAGGDWGEPYTRYLHADHLGSVQVVTDDGGVAVERRQFGVFGEGVAAGASDTKLGYTGHWQEPEHGLIDMGGRFYDPEVGQFLSSDPLFGSPMRSESFNLKAYVNNNPLRFTDPSGYQVCDELFSWCPGGFPISGGGAPIGLPGGVASFDTYSPAYSDWSSTKGPGGGLTAQELASIPNSALAPPLSNPIIASSEFQAVDTSETWNTALKAVMLAANVVQSAGSLTGWLATRALLAESGTMGLAARGAIGFADEAAASAYQGMRSGGGHAMRHLIDEGLIPNAGSLAARAQTFERLTSPILTNPSAAFNWTVGNTAARGFAGQIGGRQVVVFVAREGAYQGRVISAIVPDAAQVARWGL